MVVQSNIPAINAHRNLGINNNALSKNLEKLSSGFKINRAGDDAAGLAISEKMRSQIRGLEMAEQNTENAISLIQTAEGGLNETHAILQRMRELAVQASNGTYTTDDREQIDREYQELKLEITRIAESTHYNGINLLDGSLDAATQVGRATTDANGIVSDTVLGANVSDGTDYAISNLAMSTANNTTGASGAIDLSSLLDDSTWNTISGTQTLAFSVTINGAAQNLTVSLDNTATMASVLGDIATAVGSALGSDYNVAASATGLTVTATGTAALGEETLIKGLSVGVTANAGIPGTTAGSSTVSNYQGGQNAGKSYLSGDVGTATGLDATYNSATDTWAFAAADGTVINLKNDVLTDLQAANNNLNNITATVTAQRGTNLTFQIGANGGTDQRVTLGVANMDASSIGRANAQGVVTAANSVQSTRIDNLVPGSVNNDTIIEILDGAINQVSSQRASLGAMQNRLEHTLNSLGVSVENLSAAESTIRDTDMAKEMMKFTQNSILVQASQAMLAQANALPQGILSLLG